MFESDDEQEEILFSLAAELGLLDLTDRLGAFQKDGDASSSKFPGKDKPFSQLT